MGLMKGNISRAIIRFFTFNTAVEYILDVFYEKAIKKRASRMSGRPPYYTQCVLLLEL